jgi:tRNA(Ile)-lysidine synthase
MADRDGLYHRPFLGLTRETLRQALRDAGIEWWDDPHNDDESFARVSVRKNVMPVLEKVLGPGVTEALARTAELFREDSATLDSQAEEWFQRHVTQRGGECSVAVNDLAELGSALQTRVLRAMVVASGGHAPTYVHTKQMLKLLHEWRGQSSLNLSGASVERTDGRIIATASK